jgi:hypothetical protein
LVYRHSELFSTIRSDAADRIEIGLLYAKKERMVI